MAEILNTSFSGAKRKVSVLQKPNRNVKVSGNWRKNDLQHKGSTHKNKSDPLSDKFIKIMFLSISSIN